MRQVILLLATYLLSLAAGAPAHAAQAGDLDPTFSGDGQQTTDLGGDETAHSTAVQPDGKIVVVGDAYSSRSDFDVAVVRYHADGSLDRSFSGDGKATYEFRNATSGASDVALQGDKIVIVGDYEGPASRGESDFLAMRLNADGSPDPTFSGDGRTLIDFGSEDFADGLVLGPAGTIVVAGTAEGGPDQSDFAVARLTPSGDPDPTFSGDGEQTVDFGGQDRASAVRLQPDGAAVLVGDREVGRPAFYPDSDFALARLATDGDLDPSFSGDGKQTGDLRASDFAHDLAIQGDGRIVVAGSAAVEPGSDDFALARYASNGDPDPSFSGDGKVFTDFNGDHDAAHGVALQADGKVVAAGGAEDVSGPVVDTAVARYKRDGKPDRSFGDEGKATTSFSFFDFSDALDVAIQPDGRIVTAGYGSDYDGRSDFTVARFLATRREPSGQGCTVTRGSGDDIIRGTSGDDVICAGSGNDVVYGGGGNDTIRGGSGNDVLRGGDGNDRLTGGPGRDTLYGNGGADSLNAQDARRGNDVARGGAGADSCATDRRDVRSSC